MKTMSKKVKIILIAAIVIVVAGVALFFVFRSGKKIVEVKQVEMTLPDDANNMTGNIEEVSIYKSMWKEDLLIKGWVFKNNVKEKTRDLFLVLVSGNATQVFDLVDDNLKRPGVSEFCKLVGSADNHGYEAYIPMSVLTDTVYKVGFVIKDESGQYFSMSDKEIRLSNGKARLANYSVGARKVVIPIQPANAKIKYYFEQCAVANNVFTLSGWGFIEGQNTDDMQQYVMLKKEKNTVVYTLVPQERKGVTTFFKDLGLNLDHSGFAAVIDGARIEPGKYEILLYFVKGDQVGLTYTNQFVEFGK